MIYLVSTLGFNGGFKCTSLKSARARLEAAAGDSFDYCKRLHADAVLVKDSPDCYTIKAAGRHFAVHYIQKIK